MDEKKTNKKTNKQTKKKKQLPNVSSPFSILGKHGHD